MSTSGCEGGFSSRALRKTACLSLDRLGPRLKTAATDNPGRPGERGGGRGRCRLAGDTEAQGRRGSGGGDSSEATAPRG